MFIELPTKMMRFIIHAAFSENAACILFLPPNQIVFAEGCHVSAHLPMFVSHPLLFTREQLLNVRKHLRANTHTMTLINQVITWDGDPIDKTTTDIQYQTIAVDHLIFGTVKKWVSVTQNKDTISAVMFGEASDKLNKVRTQLDVIVDISKDGVQIESEREVISASGLFMQNEDLCMRIRIPKSVLTLLRILQPESISISRQDKFNLLEADINGKIVLKVHLVRQML